jgi:hypothetical protein
MSDSASRLLKAAPWLARGSRPVNDNHTPKGAKAPKATRPKGPHVTDRQYRDAQVLDQAFGYVFSVDDRLVKSDDPRSPLTIGLHGTFQVSSANDNRKGKKPVTLVNGLVPELPDYLVDPDEVAA